MERNSCCIIYSNPKVSYDKSSSYKYVQHSDFFYLTGLRVADLVMVMMKRGDKTEEILFMEEPTDFRRRWESDVLEVDNAKEISGINRICWKKEFPEFLKEAMLSVAYYYAYYFPGNKQEGLGFHNRKATAVKRKYSQLRKMNVVPLIHQLRVIKSDEELNLIRTSIQITEIAYQKMMDNLKDFTNERDIELFLEFEMKRNGASGFAFDPIIASGKNACILHYSNNNQKLDKKELILIDIGATYSNYHTDITRVIPFGSNLSKRQKEVYQAVLKVYHKAEEYISPGKSITDINSYVARAIESELIALGLLSEKEILLQDKKRPAYKQYYMHGASHFLGLEVHDVGSRNLPLQKNMVITLEPGIYIEKEGIGIRLENDLLITDDGCENLTAKIPFY